MKKMRKLFYGLLAVLILSFGFTKEQPVYAADDTSTLTIVADENTSRATAANATGQLNGLVTGFYAADHFIVTGLIRYDVESNGQQFEVVVPGSGDVVTLTVYIVEPGAETPEPPAEPGTPVEEPSEPETPVEEPTEPGTPVEEPTTPETPVEEPTEPEAPVEEP
ncbi:hypothetical protein, partial [Terribacillus sp. JSM ZJ617]|uniref:hypothetical protein n=1 Tax=Terribacillus sp. JSM ZJ617 TaxID=3342119 RepID=UPI0035A98E4A